MEPTSHPHRLTLASGSHRERPTLDGPARAGAEARPEDASKAFPCQEKRPVFPIKLQHWHAVHPQSAGPAWVPSRIRMAARWPRRRKHAGTDRRPAGVIARILVGRHRILVRAPAALRFRDGHPLPAFAEPDLRVEDAHPSPSNSRRGFGGRAAPPARTFAQPAVAGITRKGEFLLAADSQSGPWSQPARRDARRPRETRAGNSPAPGGRRPHAGCPYGSHLPSHLRRRTVRSGYAAASRLSGSRTDTATRCPAGRPGWRSWRDAAGRRPVVYTRTCRSGASSTYSRVPLGLRLMPWDAAVGVNPGGMGPKLRVAMIRPLRRLPTEKPRKRVHVR